MTQEPVLAVVVVTYDARALLLACLASIDAAIATVGEAVEVIVVDNASSDGSATAVADRWPEARVIAMEANLGFAGGVDAGVRAATAPWCLTLNNDAVLDPGALGVVLRVAREADADVGALALQMRFASAPGTINSAGIDVDRLGLAVDRHLGRPAAEEPTEPMEVFGASAGAALYRAEMLVDIGGFDPSYFLYLEDVDLAWRARQRGWRTLYVPAATVLHQHSASSVHRSPLKLYWVGRNRMRTLARNMPTRRLAAAAPAIVLHELAYVAFAGLTGRTFAPARGRLDGLRRWRATRASWRRVDIPLSAPSGLRGALRRQRAWASAG